LVFRQLQSIKHAKTPAMERAGVPRIVERCRGRKRIGLGSDRALENGRWLEADGFRGVDLHGFSGLGVAAEACGTLLDLEGPETDDLDFPVLFHTGDDGGENGFECFVGGALGGVFAEGGLDGINEFSFVHGNASLCGRGAGLAREKPWKSRGIFLNDCLTYPICSSLRGAFLGSWMDSVGG
jgi:hypothetical protein